MAVRKRKTAEPEGINFEQIKEEVMQLLTGQNPDNQGDFDYVALIKRITILLIFVYGISRFGVLRELAFTIGTAFVTKWIAEHADDVLIPAQAQA